MLRYDDNLSVYDLLGREVALLVNEKKAPGSYEVKFDASGLVSGVYLCRLQAGNFMQTNKMILIVSSLTRLVDVQVGI